MRALESHQMFHISVQEFKEHVRLSNSWCDLARRCGKPRCSGQQGCVTILKQKVLFLKLDTQHFTGGKCSETARARRAWIAERVGEVGKCILSDQMYQVSPQEFAEFVRLSHSWSELARRCGERAKKNAHGIKDGIVRVLKQKVLFLKLDTQHFTSMSRA